MDNIVDYLQQLDLSEVEAKLYLTLLQTGPASVRDLAQTIKIKRTTAYFYIDQLVDKGLIMKLVKGSKKLVAANEPDKLEQLVEEKLKNAKAVQQDFPKILKLLTTSQPKENSIGEAEIKYYKGKNGVRKIYEEALKSKELRSYVYLAKPGNIFPDNKAVMHEALKKNKTIVVRELIDNSPAAKHEGDFLSKHSRYSYKFIPDDMKLTAEDVLIYDGKVAILTIKENLTGIVLENFDYYNNSRELFDFIWKLLPAVK